MLYSVRHLYQCRNVINDVVNLSMVRDLSVNKADFNQMLTLAKETCEY